MLDVRDLSVSFRWPVLHQLTFPVLSGDTIGLFGESGSGKTTLLLSILGLLPATASVSGSITFKERELFGLTLRQRQQIRGGAIAWIGQEPGAALNPVLRVGTQVTEVLRAHRTLARRERNAAARAALAAVGLDGDRFFRAYPHQISGGQQQRVLIAQAMACGPALLLADEPTSSLDADTEADILVLLKSLQARTGLAVLIASHDPRVHTKLAARVQVIYGGRLIETGNSVVVFTNPLHPYTRALMDCEPGHAGRLPVIPGDPPLVAGLRAGCVFAPRCARRMPKCDTVSPPNVEIGPGRMVSCFLYES